jgi:hypothetical protein
LGFGALAFLSTVGFSRTGRTSVRPAAASSLLGLAIEFLQHLQNQKPVEWQDVRDDAIGVLVVAAICHLVYRRQLGFSVNASAICRNERHTTY